MTGKGLIVLGAVRRLLTHKDHVVEMFDSIINEMDLDPCADQTTEDLGAFSLFDLSKVRSSQVLSLCNFYSYVERCFDSGVGADKGALGYVRRQ